MFIKEWKEWKRKEERKRKEFKKKEREYEKENGKEKRTEISSEERKGKKVSIAHEDWVEWFEGGGGVGYTKERVEGVGYKGKREELSEDPWFMI